MSDPARKEKSMKRGVVVKRVKAWIYLDDRWGGKEVMVSFMKDPFPNRFCTILPCIITYTPPSRHAEDANDND